MKFDSEAAAYEFYNEYSKRIGFGIRREYANKSKKDGVLTSRRFTCFKEEKYKVVDFVAQHNHPLQPQEYVHMIRSHRRISEAQASQIVLGDESGLRPKDLHEYISKQAGGLETVGFTKQDL
ncbi:hypothetical protein P8452_70285 [Trifolium repens]|nr:hypothetical protein P8452_70285 [Trifolium repens]